MGLSITAIFICIQFSLPLSLGLLGALSIVRFRTPVKELRAILLRRLWRGSPEFRRRVASALEEILDHRLSDDFLAERYAYYRRVARGYGVENDAYLDVTGEFLTRRKAVVRRQMKGLLATSSSD